MEISLKKSFYVEQLPYFILFLLKAYEPNNKMCFSLYFGQAKQI